MRWTILLLSAILAGGVEIGPTASPVRAADLAGARQMFADLCARCHGSEGLGDGADGSTLATRPRNFHDCPLMAKDTDETLFKEIHSGSASIGRSNDMPSWGEALPDDQIRDLVAYVRSFCQKK